VKPHIHDLDRVSYRLKIENRTIIVIPRQ